MADMAIIDYWNTLGEEQRAVFREEVMKETGISYPTFYRKIRLNSFNLSETKVIKSIINEYVGAN